MFWKCRGQEKEKMHFFCVDRIYFPNMLMLHMIVEKCVKHMVLNLFNFLI